MTGPIGWYYNADKVSNTYIHCRTQENRHAAKPSEFPPEPNTYCGVRIMKVLHIDHIGVAVNSNQESKTFWSDILGLPFEGEETVTEQKVKTAFFPVDKSEVELLESTAEDGPIAKFIEKKGQGVHHIAFRVEDIEGALAELKEKGIKLIDEKPRIGAGGAKIAFIHPKATGGVLVELSER